MPLLSVLLLCWLYIRDKLSALAQLGHCLQKTVYEWRPLQLLYTICEKNLRLMYVREMASAFVRTANTTCIALAIHANPTNRGLERVLALVLNTKLTQPITSSPTPYNPSSRMDTSNNIKTQSNASCETG